MRQRSRTVFTVLAVVVSGGFLTGCLSEDNPVPEGPPPSGLDIGTTPSS